MTPSGSPPAKSRFPSRAPHVVERLLDGELVLYDPSRQRVHALNPTAALIWKVCDGSHDDASLIEALASRYPESRASIVNDVPETVSLLASEGLLEP